MGGNLRIVFFALAALVLAWVVLDSGEKSEQLSALPALPPSATPTAFLAFNPVQNPGIPEGPFVIPDVIRTKPALTTAAPDAASAQTSETASFETPFPDLVAALVPSASVVPEPTVASTRTPAEEDPAVQALRELQGQSPDDQGSLVGGVRNPRPRSNSPVQLPVTPTGTPEPTPTPGLPRVGGVATGYTMLYLMHPKARFTVERQVEAMIKANLDEVYLGVLADGTFSIDFDYLDTVVRRLAADDRAITLVLYFSNGSAMRNYDRTPINAGFNLIPPDAFRALIEFDNATRLQFQQMVSRAIPTFELNRMLNPRSSNIAIVMLEDNLDQDSYRAMRDLAAGVLGDRAEVVRNPCPGCFDGNDAFTTDPIESHDPGAVQALPARDGFSLDGSGYELPGDFPNQQLTLDTVRQIKTMAISRGIRYFGLWRKQRQGLGDTLIHPSNRNYEVASDAQLQVEIELLRWGLEVLNPQPEPEAEQ